MATIVRGAKLEDTTMYIRQVRKKLPKLLKEKIGAGHENWTSFLKAVQDIDTDHIREGVNIWWEEQEEQATIKHHLQQLEKLMTASPMALLRQQFSTFDIGGPGQPPSPAPAPS